MLPSESIEADVIGARLDEEIELLHSQIATLKHQLKLQTSTILSAYTKQSILANLKAPTPSTLAETEAQDQLLKAQRDQKNQDLETVYRLCSTITTSTIQDPDPNAVDDGRVLSVRFDICNPGGKFVPSYYIMLNRPYAASAANGKGKEYLRVHRHTFPPCIPVGHVAEQWLSPPVGKGEGMGSGKGERRREQDVKRFVRELRKEVVAYHRRLSVIKDMRRRFGLDEKLDEDTEEGAGRGKSKKRKRNNRIIEDISAADAEAKQIRIEWTDGRVGRIVVGSKGEVLKCVITGEDGRDRLNERRVLGGNGRVEGVGERLAEGIY